MAEPWVLVDDLSASPELVELPSEESHHVSRVLRLGEGDSLIVADGCGKTGSGVLQPAGKGRMAVALGAVTLHPPEPPGVTLAMGVLHGNAQELVIRQAVEVGVRRFVPVLAARSQLGASAVAGRLDRWRRVARQAIKQCRRPWVLEIGSPIGLPELLAGPTGLVADPTGVSGSELALEAPVTLLIGPEGGLTDGELSEIEHAGWVHLSLGPYTLRAETAAVIGAALVRRWCRA